MEKKVTHFYHGKVFYDEASFLEHVKNFPELPLNEKDFFWLFAMVSKNIWINLEIYDCIPKGKEWNEWLDKFFIATLNKFLKEKNK